MTKISNQYSLTNILTADLANSRLGINNVSPTVALDVTGAGKFSGALTVTGGIIASAANGNIRIKGSTDGFLGAGESDNKLYLTDWTTGAKGLIINLTNGASTFSSSVTVNGASATTSLNVIGSGPNGILLDQDSATAGASSRLFFKMNTQTYAMLADSNGLNFLSGATAGSSTGSPRMTITSGGNVAINNTTGTIYSKLSVAGAISFNNNTNSAVSGGEYGNAYAKTISVIAGGSAVSIKPGLGPESSLILVSGRSTTGNRFSDLILVIGQGTTAPTVIASRTYLSPATRTYTNGGESLVLQLTGSSETYTIFLTGIGGNESS